MTPRWIKPPYSAAARGGRVWGQNKLESREVAGNGKSDQMRALLANPLNWAVDIALLFGKPMGSP